MICKPIVGWPCFQWDGRQKDELNAFLKANGGNEARVDEKGRAEILTIFKNESRFIYAVPGSWIRALDKCQFTACTDRRFRECYELVDEKVLTAEPA